MALINAVLDENIAAARYIHLIIAPARKDFVARTAFYIKAVMTCCVAAGAVSVITENFTVATAGYRYGVVARAAVKTRMNRLVLFDDEDIVADASVNLMAPEAAGTAAFENSDSVRTAVAINSILCAIYIDDSLASVALIPRVYLH